MHTNISLFGESIDLGIGYHNIGTGVMRYAHDDMIQKLEHHYGQRCGHIPWNADNIGILVEKPDDNIKSQMEYLSQLAGRKINVYTPQDIINYSRQGQIKPLIVPYVNVPETVNIIEEQLNATSWGLPGKMTDILKNKSGFYKLVDELSLTDFVCPEYITADVNNLITPSLAFLKEITQKYQKASLSNYPLGLMLRASDEDGNYGSALAYENNKTILVVPDGSSEQTKQFANWQEALEFSQKVLLAAMNIEKESRVVVSRFVEFIDSPGLSLVITNGKVTSLGWNGQLQKKDSKACIGTHTYHAETIEQTNLQRQYEQPTADAFENFLKQTAWKLNIDFSNINGLANIDIMLPSDLEKEFIARQGKQIPYYIAECNARWTNYTDGIGTVMGITGRKPTAENMLQVIKEGITNIDKYPLPEDADTKIIREMIFEKDSEIKNSGARIICRMADNPMGVIFAGDKNLAKKSMNEIIETYLNKYNL